MLLLTPAAASAAQERVPREERREREGEARLRERVSERGREARPAMERLALVVQRRLGLTNEQAQRLRQTTARYAGEREALVRQERSARRDLRALVAGAAQTDQERVGALLDTVLRVQRRRVELVEQEQRELARFLTPLQRAQFHAMQERAFRAAQQLRMRRELRTPGAGRGAEAPLER